MSAIPSLLKKEAEIGKQAQYNFVRDFTASTIAHLMKGGVSAGAASEFAKEACEKHPDIQENFRQILVLEKAAEYIEQLETQVDQLNSQLAEAVNSEAPVVSEHIQKLAKAGFSQEELTYLQSMPDELIEKVATVTSEPWQLGKAAGVERGPSDPLLDFILK